MPAWDTGPFENDEAGDWLFDLDTVRDLEPVLAALRASIARDPLPAREGAVALVCCELIAGLAGSASKDLPPDVRLWLRSQPAATPADVAVAAAAATRVGGAGSELAAAWAATEDAERWQAGLAELGRRLATAVPPGA